MKQTFKVTGMTCSACSAHVEKAVSKLTGVTGVSVSLLSNSMMVDYDPAVLGQAEIVQAVVGAGYGASAAGEKSRATEKSSTTMEQELAQMKRRLIWSFVFMLP